MYKHGNNVCFLSLGTIVKWLTCFYCSQYFIIVLFLFFYNEWRKSEKKIFKKKISENKEYLKIIPVIAILKYFLIQRDAISNFYQIIAKETSQKLYFTHEDG